MFLYKNLFFDIFYSFNPNHAYWNQRRLFSGNLPGMVSLHWEMWLQESFARAKNWVKELNLQANNIVIALAGNKCDLEPQRAVSRAVSIPICHLVITRHKEPFRRIN